jgi:hypothetical protein
MTSRYLKTCPKNVPALPPTLKAEVAGSPKILIDIYHTARCHISAKSFSPSQRETQIYMAICTGDASALLIIFLWYSKPQTGTLYHITQTPSIFTDLYHSFILYTASYMFRHSAFSWEAQQTEPRHSGTQAT